MLDGGGQNVDAAFLITTLSHFDVKARLKAAQIIYMVEEMAALDALGERYKVETDADVKAAVVQAVRRLRELQGSGFNTLEAIFRYFNLQAEIEYQVNPRE